MAKCVNENCKKDPFESHEMIIVNADGDAACNSECALEYEKQKEEFFKNIGNDDWYNKWMFG